MRIGNFAIFETIEKPKAVTPHLDLSRAEVIFKRANGSIKGDNSGAVPFAIVETAKALGAEVTVLEQCADEITTLENGVEETRVMFEDVRQATAEKIAQLQEEIREHQRIEEEAQRRTENRIGQLQHRRSEVEAVANFFQVPSEE